MLYTFVAAIPQREDHPEQWQERLRQQLAAAQITPAADARLLHGDDLVGFYQFIDLEEGLTLFHAAPWLALAQECPWFQGLAGFFSWTHVADQALAEERLLPRLAHASTVIARTDDHAFRQSVRLIEFSLTNLLSRHGFYDGDAFLSRDEAYLLSAYDEVAHALQAAGLAGHVVMLETAHNPLQLAGDLYRGEASIPDATLALAELSVQIWAYDWDILKDPVFWQD